MVPAKNGLSFMERQVIAEIRALRGSPGRDVHRALIEDPAAIMYHFLVTSRGHVDLRVSPIARELGTGMKKLQRSFRKKYGMSMQECQLKARLDFSKYLLQIYPPQKIAAIAASLGYKEVRDFNHFFHNQTKQTPTEWMQKAHERIASIPVPADERT